MGFIQGLERLEQIAQKLPKTYELAAALVKGILGFVAVLVLLSALVAAGMFRTDVGLKAFGVELNWKGYNQLAPTTTAPNANYVTMSELKNDFTWVQAKCGEPNEEAVSGACTVDPESLGWMLQGAGIQDKQTWGCLFRRAVFVKDTDVPPAKERPKGSLKLSGAELGETLSIAAKSGRAAARVLCAKVGAK